MSSGYFAKLARENPGEKVDYSYLELDSDLICIDLMTDSGTAALSSSQWSDIMIGDEAYSGGKSWKRFRNTCKELFGFDHVFPAHQGRACENVLFGAMFSNIEKKFLVAGNGTYDTTKTNLMLGTKVEFSHLWEWVNYGSLTLSTTPPKKSNFS